MTKDDKNSERPYKSDDFKYEKKNSENRTIKKNIPEKGHRTPPGQKK